MAGILSISYKKPADDYESIQIYISCLRNERRTWFHADSRVQRRTYGKKPDNFHCYQTTWISCISTHKHINAQHSCQYSFRIECS